MKKRILIAVLCLLSCVAIALQLVYEGGAVIQGFPASGVFIALFWWQLLSIPLIILGVAIGIINKFRHSWMAPVALLAAAAYPSIIAATTLWPTKWAGWLATFKSFPKEGALRLSVVYLPAFFTILLCIIFLRRLRRNQVYEGV